jgi:pimeloyl-ACP methyl ester carboxylesterase
MEDDLAHRDPHPLWRLLLRVLAGAAVLYLAACLLLWAQQRSLIYYPVATRLAQVPVEVLRRDGLKVLASVQPRPGADAVLYFGGNAEDVSRTVPQLAVQFPDAAIYALHYRGYGGSEGRPSEEALVGDALALFDRAARGHPSITLVGRSLGSGIAVQVAAARPTARLVLVTPFDSLAGVAARHYPWMPVRWLLRDDYDAAAHAGRVRAPTTLLIAERDVVIPPEHARDLLRAFAPGVARAVSFPEAGHDDIGYAPGYAEALAR